MRRLAPGFTGFICAVACATIALAAAAARADDFPTRPIRVIVGFGPSSGADITARVVGARMSEILGQQIVVENKTGAGSSIAAEVVARASKDGYTLMMATISQPINAIVTPATSATIALGLNPCRYSYAPPLRYKSSTTN